ncbi:MAG: CPBP family intramembrane metalloprotease [Lachnospiraceae bacterium]|nr:CPBP family intramembrane metalloprotease [Lachnospiraceae bacterium]
MNKKSETGAGRKLWRVFYPALAYNGVSYLVSLLATFVIMGAVSLQYDSIHTAALYQEFLEKVLEISLSYAYEIQAAAALLSIPLMMWFLRMDKKRKKAEGTWRVYEKVAPMHYLFVLLLGLAASFAANNMMVISGLAGASEEYTQLTESFFKGNLAIEFLGLGLIIPIAEEMVFRGLMYERMKEILDFKWAVVLAAFSFGVVHGNLVQGVFSFFLGLLMIYVYERYHSLLAPVLFHMASNILAVIQSETGFLEGLLKGPALFYGSTLAMSGVLVGMVLLIEKYVQAGEVLEEAAAGET